MEQLFTPLTRAVSQIDRIINVFVSLCGRMFWINENGYLYGLIQTILHNDFLLFGLILMICGSVIGFISRLIRS